jgi:hypothetical protein
MPPRKGINPFTRKETEFKAQESTAIVRISGADVGSNYWAKDGSPSLIVDAHDDSLKVVTGIAEEVARYLGAKLRLV